MAPRSEAAELEAAWRALGEEGASGSPGWRTIAVATPASPVRAGRRMPGNEESVLAGFEGVELPPADQLPQGHGFEVLAPEIGAEGKGRVWLALCRHASASREMFSHMTTDVLDSLAVLRSLGEAAALRGFLARIRAWQDFMQRGGDLLLGPEAELGLCGELELLESLMDDGADAMAALNAWMGPAGGVHDFLFAGGALEVKSTVAANGFPARIGSLQQLDDAGPGRLYLAGVRFRADEGGRTLSERVRGMRERLEHDPAALHALDTRLLHAGFHDALAHRHARRLRPVQTEVWQVGSGFPRLVAREVPAGVTRCTYEIEIGDVARYEHGLSAALKDIGAR